VSEVPNLARYSIIALYPGNLADYQHPAVTPPALVLPCTITGIWPDSGYLGQRVRLSGVNLTYADQEHFILDAHGDWFTQNLSNPTGDLISVETSGFTPLQGSPPYTGTFLVHTPAGWCQSPWKYTVMGAPPPQPPPPPPPTPVVTNVIGDALPNAISRLQQDGFGASVKKGPTTPQAVVYQEDPQAGAHANKGTTVSLTTYDPSAAGSTPGGYSKVTLENGSADGLSVWLWDATAPGWVQQGTSLAKGAETDLGLSGAGHTYTIYAVFESLNCGPQDTNCNVHWQNSYVGDPNGPATYVPIG